jgi:hypothetical protein
VPTENSQLRPVMRATGTTSHSATATALVMIPQQRLRPVGGLAPLGPATTDEAEDQADDPEDPGKPGKERDGDGHQADESEDEGGGPVAIPRRLWELKRRLIREGRRRRRLWGVRRTWSGEGHGGGSGKSDMARVLPSGE